MEERRYKWNSTSKKNQQLLMLLFANDRVTVSNTEDNVQKAAHK